MLGPNESRRDDLTTATNRLAAVAKAFLWDETASAGLPSKAAAYCTAVHRSRIGSTTAGSTSVCCVESRPELTFLNLRQFHDKTPLVKTQRGFQNGRNGASTFLLRCAAIIRAMSRLSHPVAKRLPGHETP